jgi:DNA repair protein RadD
MQLRPHQQRAVELLRKSLAYGNLRPVLAAPCSFGKTIIAAYILKSAVEKGKRGIFICDRVKLVQQTIDTLIAHDLPFGVIQGVHEYTDYRQPIQVASIQTLVRRRPQDFDIAIVDECHNHYKGLTKIMEAYSAVPFIGLSATPYSKGLGRYYDDLILPITPRELLDQGYLCPVDYYGGKRPELAAIRKRRIGTGGSDWDEDALGEAYSNDKSLRGDIIKNWKRHAEGMQTIAFSPSIKHSKFLVEEFNKAGIPACHIDGYMDDEERQFIYAAHDAGEYMVLSCSRLLNTGYDAPQVQCLIDCFPTMSLISYVQRAGRIMRTAEGKDRAIYLDHAGNVQRHGFAEDIIPESLDDGSKAFRERNQVNEKKEPDVKECPECTSQFVGIRCNACGYTVPITERMKTDTQILQRLSKSCNAELTKEQKADWLGGLYLYAKEKGYSQGWAAHKYRTKFGVWPNKVSPNLLEQVPQEVKNWITSQRIRYLKGKEKHELRNYLRPIEQGQKTA